MACVRLSRYVLAMRALSTILATCVTVSLLSGCFWRHGAKADAAAAPTTTGGLPASIPPVKGEKRTAFALNFIDIKPGLGKGILPRQCVYAHYTGWLTDGMKFDSSRDTMPNGRPKSPLAFPLGVRRVITGWELGFEGMNVGGIRRLFIPYQLAYGDAGRPPTIPPKSALIFDIELMAVADTVPHTIAGPPQCPPWASMHGD
jgi:peptidylprolyl isomerase